MKKKGVLIIIVMITSIIFSGCNKDNNSSEKKHVYPSITKNEMYLYHRYNRQIVAYDKNDKKIKDMNDNGNWFQYDFSPFYDKVYTSGDSYNGGFEVIEIEDNKSIKSKIKLEDNEGIFPFVCHKDKEIFMHCYYDNENNEIIDKRRLCTVENGKINEIDSIKGGFDKGVIWKDKLYYTEYMYDQDNYKLYVVDINGNILNDSNMKPQLIKAGLERGDILATKYGVMYFDNNYFVYLEDMGKNKIEYKSISYASENSKYVYQIGVTNDAELQIFVIDLDTGEVVWNENDVIDFKIEENKVTVYGEGIIKSRVLAE